MVWIKRILFVLAIVIVFSGHFIYNRIAAYREQKEAQKYSKITALTWVAAAKFNSDIEKFHHYRDSLLKSEDITKENIDDYLKEYQKTPEKYIYYSSLVSYYVDSLVKVEDSTLKVVPNIGVE